MQRMTTKPIAIPQKKHASEIPDYYSTSTAELFRQFHVGKQPSYVGCSLMQRVRQEEDLEWKLQEQEKLRLNIRESKLEVEAEANLMSYRR